MVRLRDGFWLDALRPVLAGIVSLSLAIPMTVNAQVAAENPRLSLPGSRLGPDPDAGIFLTGQVGIGGAFSESNDQYGYGGGVLFHPGAAADFLDFLYGWNAGLVLRVDYQEMYHSYRIRSGDLVIRRYLGPVDDAGSGLVPFVGLGVGISQISFAAAADSVSEVAESEVGAADAGVELETSWSFLFEFGGEIALPRDSILFLRGQYRHYNRGGHDYINWSARLGLGLRLLW